VRGKQHELTATFNHTHFFVGLWLSHAKPKSPGLHLISWWQTIGRSVAMAAASWATQFMTIGLANEKQYSEVDPLPRLGGIFRSYQHQSCDHYRLYR
jgi:hypothetical protein